MSEKSLKELKNQIKEMGDHRREVYDLSPNPEKRLNQVKSMVSRMDDAVEASRLELLLLKGDKPLAKLERQEADSRKEQMYGEMFGQIKLSEKGKGRLDSLLNSRFS